MLDRRTTRHAAILAAALLLAGCEFGTVPNPPPALTASARANCDAAVDRRTAGSARAYRVSQGRSGTTTIRYTAPGDRNFVCFANSSGEVVNISTLRGS